MIVKFYVDLVCINSDCSVCSDYFEISIYYFVVSVKFIKNLLLILFIIL